MRERTGTRRRPALSARMSLAAISTFLVVLHIVAALSSSLAHQDADEGGVNLKGVIFTPTCVAGAHRSENGPARDDAHSQCCVLCDARIWTAAFVQLMETAIAFSFPLGTVPIVASTADDSNKRPPPGWASSWSSQSPPFFS